MSSPSPLLRKSSTPGAWPASFAASTTLHVGAFLCLAALGLSPFLRPGEPAQAREARLVFDPIELELEALQPEPPHELEDVPVEAVVEEPTVRVAEVPPEEFPDEQFLPVDLDPAPVKRVDSSYLRRPQLEVTPAPAPDPIEETVPEDPAEDVGAKVDDQAPIPIAKYCTTPGYPQLAVRRGWSGTVVCCLTIDAQGEVIVATVERSSGYSVLDDTALHSVRTWRFKPGTKDGQPTQMDVLKSIEYRLPGRG